MDLVGLSLLLALTAVEPDSAEGWSLDAVPLVWARAGMTMVEGSPRLDSSTVDLQCSVSAWMPGTVDFLAVPAFRRDSTSSARLRRARLDLSWPGTPWVGCGVFLADHQPFSWGLSDPLLEWHETEVDSLMGARLTAGGILGFRGSYLVASEAEEDSLRATTIRAPWLGFGSFSLESYRMEGAGDASRRLDMVKVWTYLPFASPHLVVAGDPNRDRSWGVMAEVRDLRLRRNHRVTVTLVPQMELAGDSMQLPSGALRAGQRRIGAKLLVTSTRRMLSGWVYGSREWSTSRPDSLSVGVSTVTEGSMLLKGSFDMREWEECSGRVSATFQGRMAQAGCWLEASEKDWRVGGVAGYSPRRDVHAFMELSGSSSDDLDPIGSLTVVSSMGPIYGMMKIGWEEDEVDVQVGLKGVLR
jgi:hypothetical protein